MIWDSKRTITFHPWALKCLRGLHLDWICSSSRFVFPDSQKQLWCVLISATAGQRTGLHITDVFLLGFATIFMCACVHACAFDGKWGEDPTEPAKTEQTTSSHYPLGGWAWRGHCYMYHMHTVQTLAGIIYLHFQMQIRTHHTHALSICLVGFWSHLASVSERAWLWCWSVSEGRLTMERGEKEKADLKMRESYRRDCEKSEQRCTGQINVKGENTWTERKKRADEGWKGS